MSLHRIAEQKDLPAIVAIYNSTIASREVTADTEEVSVASRQDWFDAHNPEKRPLWVLEMEMGQNVGKQIIGWLSFSNFYGRPAYSGTVELSVYLHPAARGKGLGIYCLKLAEAHAPQVGVHTLLGFIFGHNTPSLSLFKKMGYQQWAQLPNVANLDGIERDLIILGKRIPN
jgi:phosphinothricin acetyltransferase